jgi:hypothetical protein
MVLVCDLHLQFIEGQKTFSKPRLEKLDFRFTPVACPKTYTHVVRGIILGMNIIVIISLRDHRTIY